MSNQPFNMQSAVSIFIICRDKLKAIQDQADAEKKAWQARKDTVEGLILQQLEGTGQTSARTNSGTATISRKMKATIGDKEIFRNFVTENKLFDLIDWKANAIACKDYAAANKQVPPGVNLHPHTTVNVRIPTKSGTLEEDND